MKAGDVTTQLAGHRLARLQARQYLLYLWLWLLPLTATYSTKLDPLPNTAVPFRMLGNSMFVEGTLNGVPGWYLFDIGAPFVILNSAYFEANGLAGPEASLMSLHGEQLNVGQIWLEEASLGSLQLHPSHAYLLDLTAMERIKKIPIRGIIGYDAIRGMEIRFDFHCLTLFFGHVKIGVHSPSPIDSVEFKMSGHIPYVQVKLAGKTLKLGIDSGSEFNLIQKGFVEEPLFQQRGQLRLAGLTEQATKHPMGFVRGFELGGMAADSLDVILADLNKVIKDLPTRLHGLLGVSFLKQYTISINYKRKKMYFWQKPAPRSPFRLCSDVGYPVRSCQFFDGTRRKIGSVVALRDQFFNLVCRQAGKWHR